MELAPRTIHWATSDELTLHLCAFFEKEVVGDHLPLAGPLAWTNAGTASPTARNSWTCVLSLVNDSGASRFRRSAVCGGGCGHGSCAKLGGMAIRARAVSPCRPTLPCARGRAKRLCPPPRRGQSYVTLGPARVGTKTISRVTVGAHTCQGQSYVTLALTRVDTNGHRRGALVPTRVDPKVT